MKTPKWAHLSTGRLMTGSADNSYRSCGLATQRLLTLFYKSAFQLFNVHKIEFVQSLIFALEIVYR